MDKDTIFEIDIKTFDKSIDKCIEQLTFIEKEIETELNRLTYFAGCIIVREARANVPVKTKSLWRSIHCSPAGVGHAGDQGRAEKGEDLTGSKGEESKVTSKEIMVQVGSWLDYAYWIERGTRKMDARPYLFPAMEGKFKEVTEYIAKGLHTIIESRRK